VDGPGPRPLTAGMRGVFIGGVVAVLVAGFQLYVLSEETERWFAWTIGSPLTAAFLGGWYWMALVLVAFGARETTWAPARVPLPGVLAFMWTTLAATLLHLDLFHFDEGPTSARVAAWVWIVVYIVGPPGETFYYVRQLREPGVDRSSGQPLPAPFRIATAVLGGGLVVLGVGLFVHPAWGQTVWPWPLTPLTARAIAAWLVGWGFVHVSAVVVDDWGALRSTTASLAVFVVLQAGALARYGDEIAWERPVAVIYVATLVILLGGSAYGLVRSTGRSWSRPVDRLSRLPP
jgi:hypothetical protein